MLQHSRRRALAARLLAPVLALTALVPVAFSAPASAGIGTPGCSSGGVNFSDISTANAWVSAGFANGTTFIDALTSDPSLRTAKEWMSGGWGYISPDYVDLMGNGVALTTGNYTSLPVVQYYDAGTSDASCSMYFRMRLAVPAESPAGQLANVNYKIALGNGDSGTVAWAELNGHDNFVQLEDGAGNVQWSTAIDGGTLGSDASNFWVDTTTASDGHGYWVNWRIPTAQVQTYTPGVLNHAYAALGGTSSSSAAGTWNKDCTDGFPAVDPHGHSLDSCAPSLYLWQYIFDAPVLPTMTIANGMETGTVVEDTRTVGTAIAPVHINYTSGTIDTFTVDCNPNLPANLTVTPIEGESVTSSSAVSISGTLALNATIGDYHCVITAWSPAGPVVTDYYLHVLPIAPPVVKLSDGTDTNTAISDTQTTGSQIDTVTLTVDPTSGPIDTYTITCTPPLPDYLVAVPTPNSGESVTSASQVKISGVLADTATVGTYHCTITAHGPGGTSNTYYTLVVKPVLTTAVVGSGSVSPSVGTHVYLPNETVTLTATPSAGWQFTGWTGACADGSNPMTLTMNASKSCTAVFEPITYALTTAKTGSGSVTSGGTYNSGDTVTITATPASGWHFVGWSGDCSGMTNPYVVTMTGNKSCTANFEPNPIVTYKLTVSTDGDGTATPGTNWYNDGSKASAVAAPAPGWIFTGWTGACTGAATTCEVLMTMDKSITAHFVKAVEVTTHTNGSGNVNSSQPTGTPLLPGTKVTLTATPATGWKFTGWSGSCSGTDNPLTVTLDMSKDCIANFAEEPKPVELIAKDDTFKTSLNTTLKLPAGASILKNDGSTATSVSPLTKTKHGTITLAANGRLVYKPNKGFVGVDSFKYKAFDSNGRSVIATVRIVVVPPKPTDIKTGR